MKNQNILLKSFFMFLLFLMLGLTYGLNMIEAAEVTSSALPAWKGNINVGANMQTGNTDRFNAAVGADALRKSVRDRYSLNFLFNYSEEDGENTAKSYYWIR